MPEYKVEAWISFKDEDAEEVLEDRVRGLLLEGAMRCQAGPVVYRIFR